MELNTKLKIFIRDLMGLPESQILSGRVNDNQDDFETDYIVVDSLASVQRITGNIDYDGVNEVQKITNNYITTFTLDFYGNNAYQYSNDFACLIRSQQAYELKKDLQIAVYQVSTIQDLKRLTGQQYGNRYQVSVKVQDYKSVNIDTLRIDTVQTNLINN